MPVPYRMIDIKTSDEAFKSTITKYFGNFKKFIKAPSTVKYTSIEIKDQDICGRIYLVVEFDSQNGFGACIRSKCQVVLQCVNNDGSYEVGRHAFYQGSVSERIVKNSNNWNLPKFCK